MKKRKIQWLTIFDFIHWIYYIFFIIFTKYKKLSIIFWFFWFLCYWKIIKGLFLKISLFFPFIYTNYFHFFFNIWKSEKFDNWQFLILFTILFYISSKMITIRIIFDIMKKLNWNCFSFSNWKIDGKDWKLGFNWISLIHFFYLNNWIIFDNDNEN